MTNRIMHKLGAMGMLYGPNQVLRKNFGRPVRKKSRKGQPGRFNKTGHRNHKG